MLIVLGFEETDDEGEPVYLMQYESFQKDLIDFMVREINIWLDPDAEQRWDDREEEKHEAE